MPAVPDAILRHADPRREAAACVAVYAPYFDASACSFEEAVPDEAQLAERIAPRRSGPLARSAHGATSRGGS